MSEPIPAPATTKAALRAWAMATRRASAVGAALREHLSALPEWQEAHHILLYAALPDEPDFLPLVAAFPEKAFLLPRCGPHRSLSIHRFPCPLVTSRFGIAEPAATEPAVAPTILDLVVVPALALDQRGYRLGYGGGYYDRFLLKLRTDAATVGAVADALLLPTLPHDSWDIRLKILLTEHRCLRPEISHDINFPAVPL